MHSGERRGSGVAARGSIQVQHGDAEQKGSDSTFRKRAIGSLFLYTSGISSAVSYKQCSRRQKLLPPFPFSCFFSLLLSLTDLLPSPSPPPVYRHSEDFLCCLPRKTLSADMTGLSSYISGVAFGFFFCLLFFSPGAKTRIAFRPKDGRAAIQRRRIRFFSLQTRNSYPRALCS